MAKAVRAKGTTPKALNFEMMQQGTTASSINNGGADSSSFRVLYYGDASAGSVPFLWESHPGTPKHATTESSLPPLTPPPAFHQFSRKYSSPKHQSSSLQTLFHARKSHVSAAPPSSSVSDSSLSHDSSSKQSTSLRSLFLASSSRRSHTTTVGTPSYSSLSRPLPPTTPISKGQGKAELRRQIAVVEGGGHEKRKMSGGGSPTSPLCFGGVLMKVYRMTKVKDALMSIGGHGHGKTEKLV